MKKKNKFVYSLLIIFIGTCGMTFANTPIVQNTTQSTQQQTLNQGTNISKPTTPQLKPVNTATTQTQVSKQAISFESCVRAYQTSTDNLFLLALAAINSSGYKIDELQSRTGLISFEAENKNFLISVTELDENSSMLKITPMNNSYVFSPTIIENIFLYLTNNLK